MSGGAPETARPVPLGPPRACPICGRKSSREDHPFCSKRCADVDLNRWLSGAYAIPGAPVGSEQQEPDD